MVWCRGIVTVAAVWADEPGGRVGATRAFHDGNAERWWAADACLSWWEPDGPTLLVIATADPGLQR